MNPEILCHPNIPKPLHGIAPRVIAGGRWWDIQRKAAYAKAGYRCEACGTAREEVEGANKWLEAHEMYLFDYLKGRLTFDRLVALCPYCHSFIHSGRLGTLLDEGKITEAQFRRIIDRGREILRSVDGLLEMWESRHEHECRVRWQDWRMVFAGIEYGPSTTCFDDWMDGKWKEWKPPVGAPSGALTPVPYAKRPDGL